MRSRRPAARPSCARPTSPAWTISASSSTRPGKTYGACDILVNNAGIEKGADFWDVTEADYDRAADESSRRRVFLTQDFVQKLLDAKKPGRVINISFRT